VSLHATTKHFTSSFELKRVDPGGVFEGYASIFDVIDQGKDRILPGAFRASLEKRAPVDIKLLWQHQPAEPIGVLEKIYEDERGLHVKGRLLMDVRRAREAYALMRAGALDGLSIGYKALKDHISPTSGVRTLEQVDLWEISLVTFPMQDAARIRSFKTAFPDPKIRTIRDFEIFLRDAGGFSRTQAKAVAIHGFQPVTDQRDAEATWRDVLESLRRARQIIQPQSSGDHS
jgi:HK97 family phage prohead protease